MKQTYTNNLKDKLCCHSQYLNCSNITSIVYTAAAATATSTTTTTGMVTVIATATFTQQNVATIGSA